jgi:hypothetical protein
MARAGSAAQSRCCTRWATSWIVRELGTDITEIFWRVIMPTALRTMETHYAFLFLPARNEAIRTPIIVKFDRYVPAILFTIMILFISLPCSRHTLLGSE